jgi:hypothetical protein
MNEINTHTNNYLSTPNPVPTGEGKTERFNLEAHTSKDMKVKRPKITQNDLTFVVPEKKLFSDREATKRMQAINTDIYEGAKQEKEKHVFNFKRYFTIFGILALLTAAIGYFRRGK